MVVINFLWRPESPYHQPVLNSAKFHENVEIPRLSSKFRIPWKTV